jgi:hypothetical protein
MELKFNEPMNLSYFNASGLVLQNDAQDVTSYHQLTGGNLTGTDLDRTVTLYMTHNDLNAIKGSRYLCTVRSLCYVSFSQYVFQDNEGNNALSVPATAAERVKTFVKDETKPTVRQIDLDMDAGRITITFSETVDSSKFKATALTIQSTVNASEGVKHTFSTGSIGSGISDTVVRVQMNAADITAIKETAGLAKGVGSTYFSWQESLVVDSAAIPNSIVVVESSRGAQATVYEPDATPPELDEIALDLDAGLLSVSFTEPMASFVNVTGITIQQSVVLLDTNSSYQLTGGLLTTSTANGQLTLEIALTDFDLKEIKLSPGLALSKDTSFVSLAASVFKDMGGVGTLAVPSGEAKQVTKYQADASRAQLESFTLNLDSNELNLTFTDVVDVTTFKVGRIGLQSAASVVTGVAYGLTDTSTTDSSDGYVVAVKLSAADALAIKKVVGLAESLATTFVVFDAAMISDVRGRDVIPIINGKAKAAAAYQRDITPPELTGSVLNMRDYELTLTFSEAIVEVDFDPAFVTIRNSTTDPALKVELAAAKSTSMSADETAITLVLSDQDVTALQTLDGIATSILDSVVELKSNVTTDFSTPALQVVATIQSVTTFQNDTKAPKLLSFTTDMNAKLVVLVFSEVVKSESLTISSFTLHGRAVGDNPKYQLNTSSVTGVSGTEVTITLSNDDFNNINAIADLVTNVNNTFISALANAVDDKAGNGLVQVLATAPIQTSGFVSDRQAPRLASFELNLRNETLTMTFSETMDASVFGAASVRLQSSANSSDAGAVSITLAGAQVDPVVDSTTLTIKLTKSIVDFVQSKSAFAVDRSSTFVSFTSSGFADTAGVEVAEIARTSAKQAASYVEDEVAPQLSSFSLDMNNAKLSLVFTEVVDPTTLVPTHVTLQAVQDISASPSAASVTLTGEVAASAQTALSTTVNLFLVASDVDSLAGRTDLCTDLSDCFIVLDAGAIADTAGVNATSVGANAAIQATAVPDAIAPQLVSWELNLANSLAVFFVR